MMQIEVRDAQGMTNTATVSVIIDTVPSTPAPVIDPIPAEPPPDEPPPVTATEPVS